MYKCNNCGAKFDRPKEIYETHGLDSPPFERWLVCPSCLNTDIEEDDQ